jgi:hypothetical protein
MTRLLNHTALNSFLAGSHPGPCYRIDPVTLERIEIIEHPRVATLKKVTPGQFVWGDLSKHRRAKRKH